MIIRLLLQDSHFRADLDECHGKWHGSEYRYHITADYPYFISCFRGRVPSQNKESLTSQRLRSAGSYRGRRSYSWSESARMPSFSSYEKQKPIKMGTSLTYTSDSPFRHEKRTTDRNPMTLAISDLARLNKECLIMILTDLYNDAKIAIC